MAEEQLAELQSRFDCERNTNKQLESKKTELARECLCVFVLYCVCVCVCARACMCVYAPLSVCPSVHLCVHVDIASDFKLPCHFRNCGGTTE